MSKVSDIPVGELLSLGRALDETPHMGVGAELTWIKMNDSCDFIAGRPLTSVIFDMAEPENTNKDRRERGVNFFPQSNLFQWLNSEGRGWFKPMTPSDTMSYNPLLNMSCGFLSSFTPHERSMLLPRPYSIVTPSGFKKAFGEVFKTESLVSIPSAKELGICRIDPLQIQEEGEVMHSRVLERLYRVQAFTRTSIGASIFRVDALKEKIHGVAPCTTSNVFPIIRVNPDCEVECEDRWPFGYYINPYLLDEGDQSLSQIWSM